MECTRFGPEPEWLKNKDDWVCNWISEGGEGMFGVLGSRDLPDESLDFILSQYYRFGIPFPDEVFDVARVGATAALHWADYMDPYCLLWNCSDVNMTQEWCQHTYEIFDLWDSLSREADPLWLETFVYVPGQAEGVFEYCLKHPGLQALPNHVGTGISSLLSGDYGEECWDGLDGRAEAALRKLCTTPGGLDRPRMRAYFDLAAWAGFIWLAGPLGRGFRTKNCSIFDVALQHGRGILVEGSVLCPANYRRIARAPQSCYRCGVPSWCVELTQSGASINYICEHCSKEGMRQISQFHCGSLICRYTLCPHNPLHDKGGDGMYAAVRCGQLGEAIHNKSPINWLYGVETKLLGNV